jgi:ORF6N domain
MPLMTTALTLTTIEKAIHLVRRQRVMIDEDLAQLYGVPTKRLNEAVKRNAKRFPVDFMFQLTEDEAEILRSQIATSKKRGGRRYLPRVFTQEGVAMLSCVLNSPKAIDVNLEIMRVFVRLREAMMSQTDVLRRLGLLEANSKRTVAELGLHKAEMNKALKVVFEALRQLADQAPSEKDMPKEPIGFKTK